MDARAALTESMVNPRFSARPRATTATVLGAGVRRNWGGVPPASYAATFRAQRRRLPARVRADDLSRPNELPERPRPFACRIFSPSFARIVVSRCHFAWVWDDYRPPYSPAPVMCVYAPVVSLGAGDLAADSYGRRGRVGVPIRPVARRRFAVFLPEPA